MEPMAGEQAASTTGTSNAAGGDRIWVGGKWMVAAADPGIGERSLSSSWDRTNSPHH